MFSKHSDDLPVLQFQSPTTMLACGPTGSGKTTFVKQLLERASVMFKEKPSSILYCYGSVWQPIFDEMEKVVNNINFHKGLPTKDELVEIHDNDERHFICVVDDCMNQCANSTSMEEFVCVGSHHLNMTIICLVQNLFQKGKVMRTLSLNMHYYALFENRRDAEQVLRFGRQVYPHQSKYFLDAYQKATSVPFGYLLIDLNPQSNKLYSLRTKIFPGEDTVIYRPRNEEKN